MTTRDGGGEVKGLLFRIHAGLYFLKVFETFIYIIYLKQWWELVLRGTHFHSPNNNNDLLIR